jgi:hypothetical protein
VAIALGFCDRGGGIVIEQRLSHGAVSG